MPKYIYKLTDDGYVYWSTVVDAPISRLMSRDDMKAHLLRTEYTQDMIEDGYAERSVEERLSRADKNGTSEISGWTMFGEYQTPEKLVAYNRAGKRESIATLAEILEIVKDDGRGDYR